MESVLLPKCKNFIRYKFLNKFIIVKNSGNDGYYELYNYDSLKVAKCLVI